MKHLQSVTTAITFILSINVNAAPVTLEFTGGFTSYSTIPTTAYSETLASEFTSGDTITVSYTYESTQLPSDPDQFDNTFYNISNISIDYGAYSASSNRTSSASIRVQNNAVSYDRYSLVTHIGYGLDGDILSLGEEPDVFTIDNFNLNLIDSSKSVLSSSLLPTPFPDVNAFDSKYMSIRLKDTNNDFHFLRWSVDSVTTVPVPAALWLFGSGLLGLIGVARRKALA